MTFENTSELFQYHHCCSGPHHYCMAHLTQQQQRPMLSTIPSMSRPAKPVTRNRIAITLHSFGYLLLSLHRITSTTFKRLLVVQLTPSIKFFFNDIFTRFTASLTGKTLKKSNTSLLPLNKMVIMRQEIRALSLISQHK